MNKASVRHAPPVILTKYFFYRGDGGVVGDRGRGGFDRRGIVSFVFPGERLQEGELGMSSKQAITLVVWRV